MSQLFSGKDKYHIVYQPFDADAKYHVPTTESDFGRLIQPLFKKSLYHQGVFAVNGERFLSLEQSRKPS